MDPKTSVKALAAILVAMQEQAAKAFSSGDYEVAATLWEDLGKMGWLMHHRTDGNGKVESEIRWAEDG